VHGGVGGISLPIASLAIPIDSLNWVIGGVVDKPPPPPSGDMCVSVYDPNNVKGDIFDLANVTGTLRDGCLPERLQKLIPAIYIQATDPGNVGEGSIWIIP